MSETRTASLNPNDAVQGGILDDADVLVKEARFALWDYNGKAKTTTALRVSFVDGDDKAHEQYYSVGDPERFVPSDDGRKLLLTGTATALNSNSNVVAFLSSLVNACSAAEFAEFPKKLGDDIGVIDGLKAHVQRVTQAKRAGLGSDDKERSLLLVTKILALPGEKVAKAKAAKVPQGITTVGKPAAAPTAGASVPASDDTVSKTVGYVIAALQAAGGPILRQAISQRVFMVANRAKDADKAIVCKLAFEEEFLRSNSGSPIQVGDNLVAFEYDAETNAIKLAVLTAA